MSPAETILDRFDLHARETPERVAYTFLRDEWPSDSAATDRLTFGELQTKVNALAAHLLGHAQPGDRAVLLYPSSLDFVVAFLSCLRAGIIAVPANVPRKERHLGRLAGILHDCEPRLTLTTGEIASLIGSMSLRGIQPGLVLATDEPLAAKEEPLVDFPLFQPTDVAFLQYTSGSTGDPKGVIVSHANLMANEAAIEAAFGHTPATVHVGWLPLFHDMGLIGNVLQSLYVGAHCVLMTPHSFLRHPNRWLQAICRFRGTTSGAPNFAYEHTARLVTEDEKRALDLSSWQVAFNGAEPVRAATLDRFDEAFKERGFRREAWFPCYGLAECTLFASGGPPRRSLTIANLVDSELEQGRAVVARGADEGLRPIVGCGRPALGLDVRVVDPDTKKECPPGQVGMIWLRGSSVAAGYWHRPEETHEVFDARLAETGEGPFLQTGDLGFVEGGQVFITGRLKDLIIINGRNIYPQDVEAAVERAVPSLGFTSCATFAIDAGGEERLGIALEVSRQFAEAFRTGSQVRENSLIARTLCDDLISRVRQAVAKEFEIPLQAVTLLPPGSFPRTSSGKVQRRACREGHLRQTWTPLGAWENSEPRGTDEECEEDLEDPIWQLILQTFTRLRQEKQFTRIPLGDRSLLDAGYDSLEVATKLATLERVTGLSLPTNVVHEHPTVRQLADRIRSGQERGDCCRSSLAPFKVSQAQSEHDLQDVGRLRYAVTVRELRLNMRYADHDNQRVVEPLDRSGIIFQAHDGDDLVGTLRLNLLRDADVGMYFEAYGLAHFGDRRQADVSVATRLVIAPRYRNSRVFLELLRQAHRFLLEQGMSYNVIDCRQHLLTNYLPLGYEPHVPQLEHPEFGKVTVLAINLRDVDRLRRIGSPLLEILCGGN